MPSHTVTVDDASAIFEYYVPAGEPWTDSPTSDQQLQFYWDSTYHSSNTPGAQASIRFQGTAVYLFAGKRSRHGLYDIYLDGQKVYSGNSFSASALFEQIMYNATDLSPDWHNITIAKADTTNATFTEVDYIQWTTLMPDSLEETYGTTIPYSRDKMSYSSLNAWTENTAGSNPSMATSTDGASVNITFNGNGVELWGKTGRNYGIFSARVDEYDEHILTANTQQEHNALLFRQDNLPSGTHTIKLTNRGITSLAVTSARPILWRDPNNPNDPNHSGSHTPHTAVIAGVVVGAVIGLSALVFLVFFALRKRRRKQYENENRVQSSHEPAFIDATPFQLPASPNAHTPPVHSPTFVGHDKYRSEGSQYATYPLQYQPVLGSPGMSSRGSFETPSAGLGVPASTAGGSSSGRPTSAGTSRSGGKNRRASEPTSRDDIPDGVQVIRDSDAGPILLPPAYSAAMEARAPVELAGSVDPSASSIAVPVSPPPASTSPTPTANLSALPPGAASPIITTPNLGRG